MWASDTDEWSIPMKHFTALLLSLVAIALAGTAFFRLPAVLSGQPPVAADGSVQATEIKPDAGAYVCEWCEGYGGWIEYSTNWRKGTDRWQPCPHCGGKGRYKIEVLHFLPRP